MSASAINNDPSYVEFIRLNSGTDGIRKISGSKSQQEEKTLRRSVSQEQKNAVVSEKLEQDKTVQSYNFRLQQNTPAAKIIETTAIYNDTQKSRKAIGKDSDFNNPVDLIETGSEEQLNDSSIKNGFYMVVNDDYTKKSFKRLKNHTDLWREKINKKYHTGFIKEPGSLINVLV